MKVNLKKLFSFTASDSEYYNDNKDKIEFAGCKISGKECLNYLPKINEYHRESDQFYRDRDYNRAIDALEKAWSKAGELRDPDCQRCAVFFQATVIQSLESIHNELERTSKGFFATNRYQSCYKKANELLKKIKTHREAKPVYSVTKVNSALQPAYSL